MKRRTALLALTSFPLWPAIAPAQQSKRVPVIGMLITHVPVTDPVVEALREGLRQHGYEDGKNIKLEVRTALGDLEKVPALAQEMVRLKVDVVVLANEPALRAMTKASNTIPIVFTGYLDDPVAAGWIKSYRRPGGNVTGTFTANSNLIAKRLELIKETLPKVSRVAALWHPGFGERQLEEAKRLSPTLGFQIQPIEVRAAEDLTLAFDAAKASKSEAILLIWSPVFYVNRARIAAIGLEAKLPVFSDMSNLTEAGGLLSYSSFGVASFERAAHYVDKLFKGEKAADIAVEQMSNIKLVVNSKTAKALGIKFPESILVRADEVIR
jgi:putative tryptophan/tyrosine transport system substrate-binding protein